MPTLYTLGYQGASQEGLLRTLLRHDVQTLLDIRERPQSRKPGLSKSALARAAADCGIGYDHVRALGTPRDIRYRRKLDGDEAAFRADFAAYLDTQAAAVAALALRARRETCCLLCYEADYRECHRWAVADRAAALHDPPDAPPLTVTHLTITG